jgi:hypothetical protein
MYSHLNYLQENAQFFLGGGGVTGVQMEVT